MPDLNLRLNKDMLTVTPLFTAQMLEVELDDSECLEYLNILDDELVREAHRRFKLVGAHCTSTNTLRANRTILRLFGLEDALVDINRTGVQLAREAGFEHVLATVSLAEPEVLQEQVEALLSEDPDAIWLTTRGDRFCGSSGMTHGTCPLGSSTAPGRPDPSVVGTTAPGRPLVNEATGETEVEVLKTAIECIKSLTNLPLIAPAASVVTASAAQAADTAELPEAKQGADIIYTSGKGLKESLEELRSLTRLSTVPLMLCPDPGKPAGSTRQQRSMELNQLIDNMVDFALEARQLGAQFIGTAPGSLTVFTGAASAVLSGLEMTHGDGSRESFFENDSREPSP